MTELTKYVAPQQVSRDVVDGWARMLDSTAALARDIAPTDFVPKALRGNAAAVTACILAGRELGLGPMASLQNIFVIEGTPALRAQMMRALVLAHGHSYRISEWTAQRCVMWGTRLGTNQEQGPAEFTMDDARRAHLDRKPVWQAYPSDMLLARATAKLCRSVFADALAGMSYAAEELADMAPGELAQLMPAAEQPQPQTITSTVQREQRPEQPQAGSSPSTLSQPAAQGSTEVELDEPATPEQPRSSEATRQAAIARARAERAPRNVPQTTSTPAAPTAGTAPDQEGSGERQPEGPASREQGGMIHALLRELYPDGLERADRIQLVQGLLGSRVQSFSELTTRQASQLIDTLANYRSMSDGVAWMEHAAEEGQRALTLMESSTEELPDAELVEGPWESDE